MRTTPTAVHGAGIALILVTGAIHFIDAPGSFSDATYKGLLFLANGIAAVVAAFGIYRGERRWGWGLGVLVAGGALVGYVTSRTVGLPGLALDVWLEPLGVLLVIVEAAFIALYALSRRGAPPEAWLAVYPMSSSAATVRTLKGLLPLLMNPVISSLPVTVCRWTLECRDVAIAVMCALLSSRPGEEGANRVQRQR